MDDLLPILSGSCSGWMILVDLILLPICSGYLSGRHPYLLWLPIICLPGWYLLFLTRNGPCPEETHYSGTGEKPKEPCSHGFREFEYSAGAGVLTNVSSTSHSNTVITGVSNWTLIMKCHCGRKRYIVNSEILSTCNQRVKFTFINSQEVHACISYMNAHMLGNDTHVRAMKKNFKTFSTCS